MELGVEDSLHSISVRKNEGSEVTKMPEWLTITAAVVSVLAGLFGLCGVSIYINERVKHKATRKNEREDKEREDVERAKSEHYGKMIVEAVGKKIEPLEKELLDVKEDLTKLKAGVQASNRADLQALVDKADQQGWLSSYDKERFCQLYQAYHNLGKNGVMDSHRARILALPDIPPKEKN